MSEYTAAVAMSARTGDNMDVKTLRLTIDAEHLETPQALHALDQAAQILRDGGLVALPTETVYGLGANALDPSAVEKIFLAKQRPAWDPIIVHISDESMLQDLVTEVPGTARKLMNSFWPGPLTLLLPRSDAVPDAVTAGRPLVGIRMPAHPVALALIRRAGVPVAAPSANTFSHTSPTTAAHVLDDLEGRIDAILDAGPTRHGVESTVLEPGRNPMLIYRPGAVTAEQILEVAGPVEVFEPADPLVKTPQSPLPSPGVGLRHYAPKAKLVLIEGTLEAMSAKFTEAAEQFPLECIGVMLPEEAQWTIEAAILYRWGSWSDPEQLAHNLYAGLRALDAEGCTVILCPLPEPGGVGAAIRDRLRKAARAS